MWAGQDYHTLRTFCLEKGQLFEDPAFPQDVSDPKVEWKRPPEFCSNPTLIVSGSSSTDVCQGELGDCWLLSTLSSLTLHPSLFSRVVSTDQSFSRRDGYCGIFHFKLWQFGEWFDVVIDDALPTKNGRLVYTRSDCQEEIWSALLEKAYAKVCGGYSALQGGTVAETLEDVTGGIAERLSLSRYTSDDVWEMIMEAESRESLMACYIQASYPSDIGRVDGDGLVLGHAYSVLGAKEVSAESIGQAGCMIVPCVAHTPHPTKSRMTGEGSAVGVVAMGLRCGHGALLVMGLRCGNCGYGAVLLELWLWVAACALLAPLPAPPALPEPRPLRWLASVYI
ncbi:calpain-1 catalytic subunit-like [Rhinoderma darwinii]|uniref:calpain-1 catalytic subunit-like n=1 Tax=Rhinoderma darwinii TaxID=43563 RepID=UPI003F671416